MQVTADEKDRLLKVDDVAAALSVSGNAVRDWIRHGAIPYVPLPRGQYRIRKSVLDNILLGKSPHSE